MNHDRANLNCRSRAPCKYASQVGVSTQLYGRVKGGRRSHSTSTTIVLPGPIPTGSVGKYVLVLDGSGTDSAEFPLLRDGVGVGSQAEIALNECWFFGWHGGLGRQRMKAQNVLCQCAKLSFGNARPFRSSEASRYALWPTRTRRGERALSARELSVLSDSTTQ